MCRFYRSKIGVISWNPLKTSPKVFFSHLKHIDRRLVRKNGTSNQSVIKMKHIALNAVFDALSESEVKKMVRTIFDTLLVKILPQKSVS